MKKNISSVRRSPAARRNPSVKKVRSAQTPPSTQTKEQRYKKFFQNSSEGIWCFGLTAPIDCSLSVNTQIKRFFRDAYLADCNDEYAKMYGYSAAKHLIGARLEEMLAKDDPKNIKFLKDFILSRYKMREVETTEQDRKGRRFVVVNNLTGTIVDGKLTEVWGTQRDVTEKQQAEHDLRAMKDAYAELIGRIPFVVYKWRWKPTGEFILDYVSPRVKDLYGLNAEHLMNNPLAVFELIHPDDRPHFIELNAQCAQTMEPFHWEGRSLVNGRIRWIQFNSTPRRMPNGDVLWDGIMQETTTRKLAEERLRANETKYRKLVENLNEGIWVIDRNAVTTMVNSKMISILGMPEEKIVGKTLMSLFSKSERERIRQSLGRRKQGVQEQREYTFTRKDGTSIHTVIETYPLMDEHGEYAGAVAAFLDVTEKKQADEKQRRQNEENIFLKEAFVALTECSDQQAVFSLMAQQLRSLIPDGVILIMESSPDGAHSVLREISGVEPSVLAKAKKILRFDPLGVNISNIGYAEQFRNPAVRRYDVGLKELSSGAVPESAAAKIEKLLAVKHGYSVGITEGNACLGYIFILTGTPLTIESATIELFAHQCHLALTKVHSQQRFAEEACRRKTMMDISVNGIAIINQHHRVVECNQQFANMLGYTMEEALTLQTWQYEVNMPEQVIRKQFADLTSINKTFETRHRRKDGTEFEVEISANGTVVGGEPLVFVICRDISERVRLERIRNENEQKIRGIFDAMEEGLALNELIYNDQGEVIDYRILDVNPAFERIVNTEAKDIVGRLATDLYKMPSEYITAFWKEHLHDTEAIKTDLYNEQIKQWKHVSTSIPVDGRFVTSFFDITDLKNAEQALRSSEQYNRSLHDTSPNATTVTDLEGNLVYVNKQALVMYGHRLDEDLVGRNVFEWVPDYLHSEVRLKMAQILSGGILRNYQITLKRLNGELFYAEINCSLVPDIDSKPAFFLIITSDISERVIREREILLGRGRLERAESVAKTGNWEYDVRMGIIRISEGVKHIYGLSASEVPVEIVKSFSLPEFRPMLDQSAKDLLEKKIPQNVEYKIRRASDNAVVDIYARSEYHPELQTVFGVIQDITERKKAQEQIEKNEQRYRHIVDNLHQAYYESDRHAVFTYCNPGFLILSGYGEEELIGMVSFRMVAEEHRRRVIEAYVALMAERGTSLTIEFPVETKQGTQFWIEQTSHFDFDSSGLFIKASHFVKDITERKHAQERLQESEQRYRQITEAVTDYIYTVSLQNGTAAYTKHGPGCLTVTGYSPEDFDRDPYLWFHMVLSEDRPLVEQQLQKMFTVFDLEPMEHRIIRKDGSVRWVRNTLVPRKNESGTIISYDGLIQDIDERKRAEEKLRSSEERNRVLIESLPDLMFVLDGNGTHLDYHSPDPTQLMLRPAEFLGKTIPQVMPPEFSAIMMPKLEQAIKTGLLQFYEYSLPVNNTVKYFEARLIPFGENKVLNIVRDVSIRVQAEQALKTINEDLESRVTQRTAQLTEANQELEAFSYSVSHDLRAPLRAIDSFSAMLVEGYADRFDDEGKRLIGIVRSSIKKMDLLINGLLTLSRIGRSELHITRIDMRTLALSVVDEILPGNTAERYDITIGELPQISGDEPLIRQALNNLIGNAAKYSSAVEHPVIVITGTEEQGNAVISVTDNGAGFDPTKSEKLFAIFQRLHTDEQFKGLGIGLSIVQRIIHRHGGRVWADGKPNGGATFSFSIPVGKP